jgi:hypothetical protein
MASSLKPNSPAVSPPKRACHVLSLDTGVLMAPDSLLSQFLPLPPAGSGGKESLQSGGPPKECLTL